VLIQIQLLYPLEYVHPDNSHDTQNLPLPFSFIIQQEILDFSDYSFLQQPNLRSKSRFKKYIYLFTLINPSPAESRSCQGASATPCETAPAIKAINSCASSE